MQPQKHTACKRCNIAQNLLQHSVMAK